MDKELMKPVAWIDDNGMVFWANDIPEDGTNLYTTPTMPRDVLMAAMMEVCGWIDANDPLPDLNEIADRYAGKVQPEPVSQQMLAVARSILVPDMIDLLPPEYVAKVQSAIAAAEAAQTVAAPEWLTFDRLVDSLAIFVSAAAKNPARDRLTADDWADTINYMASQGGMFNAMAAIRTMLSAAQKTEGV